jgi:hypothetical protein
VIHFAQQKKSFLGIFQGGCLISIVLLHVKLAPIGKMIEEKLEFIISDWPVHMNPQQKLALTTIL